MKFKSRISRRGRRYSRKHIIETLESRRLLSADGPNLAHGVISANSSWQTITLDDTYDSMVVVATPNYDSDSNPGVVRIRNANANQFEIRVEAAGNDPIGAMNVHYVVVEEGVYNTVDHGVTMEAVKFESSVTDHIFSWRGESRSYANSYSDPVVLGQVMSDNDDDWSVFWAKGTTWGTTPTSSALKVGKHVGEDSDTTRANETIGYIVIESSSSGADQIDGMPYVAAVGDVTIAGFDDAHGQGDSYTYTPLQNASTAVAVQTGMKGWNGSWAVLYGDDPITPTGNTLSLVVDEDRMSDSERYHAPEQVAYLIIGEPLTNNQPDALPQSVSTTEDTPLAITLAGTDADGDPLTYSIDTQPAHGTLSGSGANLTYTPNPDFFGDDSFTFRVHDGTTSSSTATVDISVASGSDGPNLAHGVVNVGSSWQTVTLDDSYDSMVVVATPNYDSNSAPGVVRIRNAHDNQFEIRVDATGSTPVGNINVHYIVVEEGVYTEAEHDVNLEAIKFTSTRTDRVGSWVGESRNYWNSYDEPVVLGQVMSANDDDWSVFWSKGTKWDSIPSSTELRVGKHVGEDSDSTRADETIGYIVIESSTSGTDQIDGMRYVAAVGADTIEGLDNGVANYQYATPTAGPVPEGSPPLAAGSFVGSPTAVVTQTGMDGGDGGWAVLYGDAIDTTNGSITLGIDEDQAVDNERYHTTEQVAIFLIEEDTGLDGHWTFDDGSGNVAADSSGFGRSGSVNGASWTTSGRIDGALDFDGVNDHVDTGVWNSASNQLTIATWINADSFGATEAQILSKATGTSNQDHYWMLSTVAGSGSTQLRFRLKTDGNTDTLVVGANLDAGQWYHLAAVYDGAMMRLYIDGTEVGTLPKTGDLTPAAVPTWIGNNPSGSRPFDGRIDDMRIYGTALTALEIVALVQVAVANEPPVVDAGADLSATVSSAAVLDGTVTDDGLPISPGAVTTTWSMVSGPADVSFADSSAVDTTASFVQAGTYVLRLEADDGEFSTNDTITVTVTDPQPLTGFFVSPNGSPSGDGSESNPWDLRTALSHPSAVQPGDTIWLREGSYHGVATSTLQGTATNRITVRSYPGEHAKIDLYEEGASATLWNHLLIRSSYTDYRDIEILNSNPQSRTSAHAGTAPPDIHRGMIDVRNGTDNRFINLVVHDLLQGFGFWKQAIGGEIYGSIIYNNGWMDGPKNWSGGGHGIYTQNNDTATKFYRDNLIFNNFGFGITAYGNSSGPLESMTYDGNVMFNNGLAAGPSHAKPDFQIGGSSPVRDAVVTNNYTYSSVGYNVSFGYHWGTNDNEDITVRDNYFYSGVMDWKKPFDTINASGNQVDRLAGDNHPTTGFVEEPNPTGTVIDVRPNAYEQGRGHVIVYNWNDLASVNADLSSVLDVGATYEIHHAYDLDTPVASGTYSGGTVAIPMQDTSPPTPLGDMTGLGPQTPLPSEFGAFVVTTLSASAANIMSAAGASSVGAEAVLTHDQLQPIVDFAISQFGNGTLTDAQRTQLMNVEFEIGDLDGGALGQTQGSTITIDSDAAGYGWFVDSTPGENEEFELSDSTDTLTAKSGSEASDRMDLLTVVLHELGHVLGADHAESTELADLMSAELMPGVRHEFDVATLDQIFTNGQ